MSPRDWEPDMDEETFRATLMAAAEAAGYPAVEIGRFTVAGEREWTRSLEQASDVTLLSLGAALRAHAADSHSPHRGEGGEDDAAAEARAFLHEAEDGGGVGVGGGDSDDDDELPDATEAEPA
jgi:hypothetical protein